MKLLALVFVAAAVSAAPQFVADSQQYVSDGQQFVSGGQQFVSSGQQFVDQQSQFVSAQQPQIRIISQKFDQDPYGNYEYGYEQDNGQKVQEVGRVQPGPQPDTGSLEQQGSYEYISDDGNTYRVDYLANEGGFQPQAAHLPVAPAQIPEYAQLRQEHPELFWAENQSQGTIINDQQYVQSEQFAQQGQFAQQDQFVQQDQFAQQGQFSQQGQITQQGQFAQPQQQIIQQDQFVQQDQYAQGQQFIV
ncbi:endocuticle structural glycoprotein SgAbd-8-like [Amphibalanus amphitrite]|uniref:endocuticle structural glycoprotein SgAbd-8-like n=1 Tax=Amphibalanus amphitrite TaxID=1232801 RepID=UPI001C91B493|nr:endocuticle structural glycoprotein SgAbd-8-like [Amphibalanus amphitrite]XP_043242061.1 endocuticle structural glycoprotein SgAbd-8-like [Amphibalanus amphitrite]